MESPDYPLFIFNIAGTNVQNSYLQALNLRCGKVIYWMSGCLEPEECCNTAAKSFWVIMRM